MYQRRKKISEDDSRGKVTIFIVRGLKYQNHNSIREISAIYPKNNIKLLIELNVIIIIIFYPTAFFNTLLNILYGPNMENLNNDD